MLLVALFPVNSRAAIIIIIRHRRRLTTPNFGQKGGANFVPLFVRIWHYFYSVENYNCKL